MRGRIELWGGNRETWRGVLFSRDSLFVYTLRTHLGKRRRYAQRLARYKTVRLRSASEIEAWLGSAHPGSPAQF